LRRIYLEAAVAQSAEVLFFPPFRLDCGAQLLLRGDERIALRPKTFAVLRHLIERPGRLVTRSELLAAVWGGVHVGDALPRDSILEIRRALGDTAGAPRFIETTRGRGYRFVAAVTRGVAPDATGSVIGRAGELRWLRDRLARALDGERRVAFVTGEAGIGKTTLVETLCREAEALGVRTVHGQCVEHFGPGEPYMPLLAALGDLCRRDEASARDVLYDLAPTWLLQLPAVTGGLDVEDLVRRTQGSTRERMLREVGDAVEALTADRPLVLILEDLHWSDPSTLEALAVLARGRAPARLLAIGTYRPVDVLANGHPLRAATEELRLHRHSDELRLPYLGAGDVAAYVARRLEAEGGAVDEVAGVVHRRTEGNPLFMVGVLDDLLAGERLARVDGRWVLRAQADEIAAPRDVRAMIDRQFDRLDEPAQRILTAASVVGVDFSTASVAAALGEPVADVETRCAALVRREQFLRPHGRTDWPDGTVAARHAFQHALYRDVVRERVTPSVRRTLHARVAERLEQAYGAHATRVAAELATHFEKAGEPVRACQWFHRAADDAASRYAYREAIDHLRSALRTLSADAGSARHLREEFDVQVALGLLLATRGEAIADVERALTRAQEIGGRLGDPNRLVYALGGMWGAHFGRGEVRAARALAEQVRRLAGDSGVDGLVLAGDFTLGLTLVYEGALAAAEEHLASALAIREPAQLAGFRRAFDPGGVIEPRVVARVYLAIVRWHRGQPDQALAEIASACDVARSLDNPYLTVVADAFGALVHLARREVAQLAEVSHRQIALARQHGFTQWAALGAILAGWARAVGGDGAAGVREVRDGVAAWRATGSGIGRTHVLTILADACLASGDVDGGLAAVVEGLQAGEQSGERLNEPELLRLRAELQPLDPGAERTLRDAIAIARRHGSRAYELRAATALARRWAEGGQRPRAQRLLRPVAARIVGGSETEDLRAARAVLESP